jgi:hypothetical protein
MLGDPRSGSKVWEALDRKIGKPRGDRGQVVAHWEFQPPAAFHDRENRRNLGPRLAQLKFRIFQESRKFPPQCERVLAGLAECTGGQCNGLYYLDLAPDIIQERLGSFLTQHDAQ